VFIVLVLALLVLGSLIVGAFIMIRRSKQRNRLSPYLPQPPLASPPVIAATVALPKCPQCHLPLATNAPEGLCPACLAKVALGSEPATLKPTINLNPLAGAAPESRVAPDPAQLAAQFPQLEIIELLGMGGMGMVYKARQPRLDRIVALKILPVESQQHPSFAERFSREAKALAKLNHPGIVNIYDFGQTGQYYYFVMEYVDGMNLRHLLHNQPLEPRQALELVTQICTALQYAHDEGVVHRDIKPENILLSKKGQVKIADFGLAKLLGAAPDTALTMSQAAMGTLNYMAPEQRQNAQAVDHRADIYSLGVVFYEMLTGEVPMGRFEAPSKRVQVDVRLDEVVLKALEREPARRYQHVSEVKSNVDSITATTPQAPANPAPPAVPLGTKPLLDSSARAVPRFFWLKAYVLFSAGWLVTKLLWNFRSPGCWLACFGMAALVVWVSLKRMRLFPDKLASYSKTAPWARVNALGGIFLMLALGFVFLISAFFHYWEQGFVATLSTAKSAEQFEAEYKGKEFHLLQGLAAFHQNIPNVELAGPYQGGYSGGWDIGWGRRGPGHHWSNVRPNLIMGCACLFSFTLALIGGWRLPGSRTKLFPFSWGHARASLAVFAVVLGSALPIKEFSELAYLSTGIHGSDYHNFIYKTSIGTVTKAIEEWAGQNGYAMGDEYNWNINAVPMGNRIAETGLLEAWKPSPFDRWQSTWTSFRRISPYLDFELVSSENPVETHLKVTSIMDSIPENLISLMTKLESAPPQKPGNKETNSTNAH
jgi:tRNA A-37 threonylcarbamoyl transferase component Bud32